MLSLLKSIFSPGKKRSKSKSGGRRAAILPATPQPEGSSSSSIDTVTIVPFWYQENGSFDDTQFNYPSDTLITPVISGDIREALKRYVKDICPEPDGSLQIYEKLNQPDASVKEISALVGSDPLLAAQVLKLVNSAAFSISTEVTSIGRAVTLLGFQNVKSVVLSHSIRRGISASQDEKSTRLREHSLMSSATAYHLAEGVRGIDSFTASTIALLHDMGKILYPMILENGKGINFSTEIPLQVIESLVASVFAEIWKLPGSICRVLEYIQHPYFYPLESVPEDIRPMVTTLSMANQLANVMGFEDGDLLYRLKKEYLVEINQIDSPARWIDEPTAAKIELTRGVLK